jgi:hypothetical protein
MPHHHLHVVAHMPPHLHVVASPLLLWWCCCKHPKQEQEAFTPYLSLNPTQTNGWKQCVVASFFHCHVVVGSHAFFTLMLLLSLFFFVLYCHHREMWRKKIAFQKKKILVFPLDLLHCPCIFFNI